MNKEEINLKLKAEFFNTYKRSDKKQIWILLIGYSISWASLWIIYGIGNLINITIIDIYNGDNDKYLIPIFFGILNTVYLIYERKKMKKIGIEIDKIDKELTKFYYEEYQNALLGNDKKNALELGRKYHKFVRGKLSIYDEAAIKNDLESMKV